ncbi:response regulator [Rhizobium leguminosarum]|uniref:Response regulator n=1 Tax=Rhizobium leguminosarum TaxID=384 RepID=A0A4Q8XNA8_RHILE|nr:response regulator [Rhizobium leguminosarum]TAX63652.1 response regulator [Rhizobium leguminosarum]
MDECVLIVEDEPLIASDLEDQLHQLGYLTSGRADDFDSARRLAPYSSIALVDVNLADGTTGPRIAEYLPGEFGTAVAMVTGNSEAVERDLKGGEPVIPPPKGQLFWQETKA